MNKVYMSFMWQHHLNMLIIFEPIKPRTQDIYRQS